MFFALLAVVLAAVLVIAVHDLIVINDTPLWHLRLSVGRWFKARHLYGIAFRVMTVSGASVDSFRPEIWSALILASLKKSSVYAMLCNRDYEGEIAQAGDTVHINSVGRPTISTYTQGATVTPEALQTAERALVITEQKYFAVAIDDVDKRQTKPGLMEATIVEGAYGLRDAADQFVAGLYTNIQAANNVTTVSVTSGALAYTQLTKLGQKLDEANVVSDGRWAVLPPWYKALLLDSDRVVNNLAAQPESRAALINGYIGRLAGFDLYESNNAPLITGDDYAVIGGTSDGWTFADQITETEALRSTTTFADMVRALHVYGAKVTRPDGLAYITASVT